MSVPIPGQSKSSRSMSGTEKHSFKKVTDVIIIRTLEEWKLLSMPKYWKINPLGRLASIIIKQLK